MLRTPLQRAVTGGVIAGLAFCVSAGLEFQLEVHSTDTYLLHVYNFLRLKISNQQRNVGF